MRPECQSKGLNLLLTEAIAASQESVHTDKDMFISRRHTFATSVHGCVARALSVRYP